MSLDVHLATLEQRHSALETEIESARAKPAMSDAEIRDVVAFLKTLTDKDAMVAASGR